jgi:hypothetical protein
VPSLRASLRGIFFVMRLRSTALNYVVAVCRRKGVLFQVRALFLPWPDR